MATTLELLDMLRELLDDETHPYGWTDSYLVRAIGKGEEQIARRTYYLVDGGTASICNLSIIVSQASYALHSKVLQVKEIRIGSADIPLTQRNRDELNETYPGWWNVYGTPEAYITEKPGELTLWPTPQSVDVASILVARLPLNSLTMSGGISPEIRGYDDELLMWGAHVAYLKHDADTYDKELAQDFEDKFTARIGPLPSALEERRRKSWPRNMSARAREFGT
jgi:hypothetical protein